MEAETGYRSGDWLRASPGEPRLAYDPDTTTLTQRRQAKVAELRALPVDEAKMLGLARVSVRTLILAFNLCCLPGNFLPVLSGASP